MPLRFTSSAFSLIGALSLPGLATRVRYKTPTTRIKKFLPFFLACSSAFLVLQTRNHLFGRATRYKIQEKGTPPSFSMLLVSFADFERHMRCFEGKFYFWMTIFSDFGGLYDVSQMQEIQENLGLKTCATNKKFSGKSRYIVLQTNFIFDLVASPGLCILLGASSSASVDSFDSMYTR